MHGHDSVEGEPVVHHGEDPLLHLTAIESATNECQLLLKIERNKDLTVETILLPFLVGDVAAIDDGEVRLKVLDLRGLFWSEEHVGDKVMLPCDLSDEANLLPSSGRGGRDGLTFLRVSRLTPE
jgi:hypothetical protein